MKERARLSWKKKLVFALVIPIGLLVGIEGAARLAPSWFGTTSDELDRARELVLEDRSPHFAPYPHSVFHLRPGGHVNEYGFAFGPLELEKTPGVTRIACLGASTTQGGNEAGPKGSYPFLLERVLEEHGVAAEVMNFGISNWTSAESLVNYVLLVQETGPDIVIVHHAINETDPRVYPGFRPDYSHYRVPFHPVTLPWYDRPLISISNAYLALRLEDLRTIDIMSFTTVDLPGGTRFLDIDEQTEVTTRPFRRNLDTIGKLVTAHGGHVAFMTMPCSLERAPEVWKHMVQGARQQNEIVRELCAERGYGLIDAERLVEQHPELERHFTDLVHVTPTGNRLKAELAFRRFLELGWLLQ